MTKIVYNNCYGGFSLSDKEKKLWLERGGDPKALQSWGMEAWRSDPILINIVEERLPNDKFATDLQIAEISSGTKYRIDEYDGLERVMAIDDYDWLIA